MKKENIENIPFEQLNIEVLRKELRKKEFRCTFSVKSMMYEFYFIKTTDRISFSSLSHSVKNNTNIKCLYCHKDSYKVVCEPLKKNFFLLFKQIREHPNVRLILLFEL